MIKHANFRRFEEAFLTLLEPASAGLICDLIAARIEGPSPESPRGSPALLSSGSGLDIDLFASQSGLSVFEAKALLLKAHDDLKSALGLPLFKPGAFRRLEDDAACSVRIDLSSSFLAFLEGTGFVYRREPIPQDLRPDFATRKGLDLIAAATVSTASLRFLWRIASPFGSAGAKLELERLTENLSRLTGDHQVVLINPGLLTSKECHIGSAAIALGTLLHLEQGAVLIIPVPETILTQVPLTSHDNEDDEYRGPGEDRHALAYEIAPDASAFLKTLLAVDFTIVLAVPERTVLEPGVAALFSGAFGPYRLDRASVLTSLKASTPRRALGDRQASLILRAAGDPAFAKEILRGADAIAKVNAEGLAAYAGADAAPTLAKNPADDKPPRPRRARAVDDPFERLYNLAAEDLAISLFPHVERSKALRDEGGAFFDPGLFCGDPDPSFLFERASMLRQAGARILLTGPTGTGKSALVAELARLMALEIKQYSGASLFARPWGQTEKNIAAAAAQSRGYLAFYDEADSLMANRFTGSDSNRHLTVCATNAFLAAYQDAISGSPVIAATNRIDDIDPAIRRRFDIILTTKPLPEPKERIAWERLLKMSPPPGWTPCGDTVPDDYLKAGRQLELMGKCDPVMAAAAVIRARDERATQGIDAKKNPIGFSPVTRPSAR